MKDKNEIPFGAKDSELCGFEYTIPEGMEAEIRDGKVIVRKKESEDERIRKWLVDFISGLEPWHGEYMHINIKDVLAYLEKQKEPITRETVDEIRREVYQSGYDDGYEHGKKDTEQKEQDNCPEYCVRSHCIGCPIYEKQKEQKPEWSEEDKKNLQSCVIKLEIDIQRWEGHGKTMIDGDKALISWLKDLPNRFNLHLHWKPSEEQMEALNEASASWMNEKMGNSKLLESLYNDLKKL